ncbi:MAG: hypothetical protein J0I09_08075 [Sphingobacteriia bacterium]|nr:hypothetical protein [Sphingobacteriia bacterium]
MGNFLKRRYYRILPGTQTSWFLSWWITEPKDFTMIAIYPQMFQQDYIGIYEESIYIEDNKVTTYKPTWQSGHTAFANQWLQNIRQ